jgi:glycerol-3-phosphate dehydrogenase (NAD(P)+)
MDTMADTVLNAAGAAIGWVVLKFFPFHQKGAGDLNNLVVGLGDLYVTIYGGRTRLIGILLGRGMGIKEALDELKGVTLESLVVAGRVAKALRIKASRGEVNLEEFPLLVHMDDIITNGAEVAIPWEKFTYEK